MPYVKDREEKAMANDEPRGEAPRQQPQPPSGPQPDSRRGFFTIYKPGQGYWTRLGTGIATGLIILLTIQFLWQNLRPAIEQWLTPAGATTEQGIAAAVKARNVTLGVCIGTAAVLGGLAWWLMNKPTNADFLIATDSEMKKVNWTSKKDLIGSTKVVIAFMFLIAFFLFVVDVVFGYIFYFIDVLKHRPF
jgi:preprotein translocase subunit SecE